MQNEKSIKHVVEVVYFPSNEVICLHPAMHLLISCFPLGKKEKQQSMARGESILEAPQISLALAAVLACGFLQ